MKLADIIKAVGKRRDWIRFEHGWTIDEAGAVKLTMPVKLTPETEVSVIYQWFHHMDPGLDKDAAFEVIRNQDYKAFQKLHARFIRENFLYFPDTATIFADDEYIGEVVVAYSPDTFALIADQDYECG